MCHRVENSRDEKNRGMDRRACRLFSTLILGRSFSRTEGPRYGPSRKTRGGKATLNGPNERVHQIFESEKKICPEAEVGLFYGP